MKVIIIGLFSLFYFSSSMASECILKTDKTYFEDLEGEPIGNPKSKDYRIIYNKIDSFTPDPPMDSSLNIPYTGDCNGLIVFKIEIFRALGLDHFPKTGGAHENHGSEATKLIWDKKPIFSGKKELSFKENVASLKSFNILKMMEKAPKDKHIWKFKFIIKYQVEGGSTKTFEKLMDSPLMH